MKRCLNKVLIVIFIFVLLMAGGFAAFQYSGNNINTEYLMGQKIKGKFNISFNNQDANSFLRSNFAENISLKEFLEKNNADYECSPSADCLPAYTAVGNSITQFSLDDEKVVGFKVTGSDIFIQSVTLKATGDSGESCVNQMVVDVLDNNENFLINPSYTEEACSVENFGCFNGNLQSGYEDAIIGTTPYCNKVTLGTAPAFRIGAIVKDKTTGSSGLKMQLFNLEGDFLAECTLPPHGQNIENLNCIIEYSTYTSGEYLACIKADSSSDYKIKSESSAPTCGTASPYSFDGSIDFEIFVQSLKFGNADFKIEERFNEVYQQSLSSYFDDYILEKYGRECPQGCVIPIRFNGQSQNINLNDIMISYSRSGAVLSNNEIYNVNLVQPLITSGNLSLELEHAGFIIPFGSNATLFNLFIDNVQVFSQNINISQSFDFDIIPKFVSFGEMARFEAITPFNITNSVWKFGDNTSLQTASGKETEHTYLQQGVFKAEVMLTRADGVRAMKKFDIVVGNPRDVANETIRDYKERLLNVRADIESFPDWVRNEVESLLNLTDLEQSLAEKEAEYNSAITDEDFQNVMISLLGLKIPFQISSGNNIKIPLVSGFESFDTSYIDELSSAESDDDEALKNAIAGWMNDNFDSEISMELISAFYESDVDNLISKIKIETKPIKQVKEDSFFIIGVDKENLKFKSDYGAEDIGGGTYIKIEPGQTNKIFEFILLGEASAIELGAYISPSIENLGVAPSLALCNYNNVCEPWRKEGRENCPADCRPWKWFTIWIIIIAFGSLVVYILMQEWYKRNYENSLFPNKDDLYNLINFIYNSRRIGMTNREIKKKLIEAGWPKEKISYALKKIDGKRTGMFEIPVFKIFENRKVKKEIQKRHPEPVDARFIKRRDLGHEDVRYT